MPPRSNRARTRSTRTKTKVLLDTNVWGYLSDHNAGDTLLRTVVSENLEIVVSPGVAYEALRMPVPSIRNAQIKLLTSERWSRLMPEAYSESMELLGAIRRLRPHWLVPEPNLTRFYAHRRDWSRKRHGFWYRARNQTERESQHLKTLEGPVLDVAREHARAARKNMQASDFPENAPLNDLRAMLSRPTPGWDGDKVEVWRLAGWHSATQFGFADPTHPYRDWLFPFIDATAIALQPASWLRFWLYEIDAKAMPKFWLRWAFEHLQQFATFTSGTPGDAQLSTYLSEADLFVSADRNFIRFVDRCRLFAPCKVAIPRLIDGKKPIDSLVAALTLSVDRLHAT